MKKPSHRNLLPRIKDVVERVAPGAEIIVYGSVARGEETEESDIDLVILIDEEYLSPKRQWDITEPLYQISTWELIPISPHVYTRKEWYGRPFRSPYMINVMNEGIKL